MAHVLSNTTAEMMQMICRFHTRRGGCDEDCPLRCICTEMVKDWPVRVAGNEHIVAAVQEGVRSALESLQGVYE
jgi:hypothetical protein